MAEKFSDLVTNLDATPVVRNNSHQQGGYVRETIGEINPVADEAITTNFVLCPIPSSARVSSIELQHAEAATTGQGNIGIMRRNNDGTYTFTGGDADLFATGYDFDDAGAAASAFVEVFDATQLTADERRQQLWQALGLSEDPAEDFFIAIDVSEIFAGGPTSVLFRVRWVN